MHPCVIQRALLFKETLHIQSLHSRLLCILSPRVQSWSGLLFFSFFSFLCACFDLKFLPLKLRFFCLQLSPRLLDCSVYLKNVAGFSDGCCWELVRCKITFKQSWPYWSPIAWANPVPVYWGLRIWCPFKCLNPSLSFLMQGSFKVLHQCFLGGLFVPPIIPPHQIDWS